MGGWDKVNTAEMCIPELNNVGRKMCF